MKNRAKVLFLDDDKDVLAGFKQTLTRTKFEPLVADSDTQAFKLLKSERVDIVVSDERMPDMSGHEFLSQVCISYPNTIRILLSGQAHIEEVAAAINEGQIFKYLVKPITPKELIFVLYQALEVSNYVKDRGNIVHNAVAFMRSMDALEDSCPGITKVTRDSEGYIIVDDVNR